MGYGFFAGILLGFFVNDILKNIEKLENRIVTLSLPHGMYERLELYKNKKEIIKNKKPLIEEMEGGTEYINKNIFELNRICKKLNIKCKIEKINKIGLKKIINERFDFVSADTKVVDLKQDNFRIKLQKILRDKTKEISELIKIFQNKENFELVNKLDKEYGKGVKEAIHIYSIDYPLTSIFVVGRTVEILLDDLLKKGMQAKKIKKINLKQTKIKDKIGILKNSKIIKEKNWHDLNSIRIDRNETGHPRSDEKLKKEAQHTISKAILIISDLQKKVR